MWKTHGSGFLSATGCIQRTGGWEEGSPPLMGGGGWVGGGGDTEKQSTKFNDLKRIRVSSKEGCLGPCTTIFHIIDRRLFLVTRIDSVYAEFWGVDPRVSTVSLCGFSRWALCHLPPPLVWRCKTGNYCRARSFGSRLGLSCKKIPPWAVNLCLHDNTVGGQSAWLIA